jgi:hypothetical protein
MGSWLAGTRDDDDMLEESGEWILSSRFRCSNLSLPADMSGAGVGEVVNK